MATLKMGAMAATGTAGVLVLGMIVSELFDAGITGTLGVLLTVFVVAGAIALLMRVR